ncbi:hypothetical protein ACLUEY_01300 [Vreelandella aquamarina]
MKEPSELAALIAAIHAQTAAIQSLADSNRAVVDMLLAQEQEDTDEEGREVYLDGEPVDLD